MYYNIMPDHLGKVIFGGYDEMRQGAVETVKKALSRGPHIQLDIPSLVLDVSFPFITLLFPSYRLMTWRSCCLV